jgi:peptide deformylase
MASAPLSGSSSLPGPEGEPAADREAVDPAALTIVTYPHPALREPTRVVADVDDTVRAVAARMIELMHEARGVGLAAPQVGLNWRLFVANPTLEPGWDRVFINPELRDADPATAPHDEGCLSLPGITAEVTRPVGITIESLDEHGQRFTATSQDFAARVWQHEFDHLEGTLILDRMTRIDRMANRRALADLEAQA